MCLCAESVWPTFHSSCFGVVVLSRSVFSLVSRLSASNVIHDIHTCLHTQSIRIPFNVNKNEFSSWRLMFERWGEGKIHRLEQALAKCNMCPWDCYQVVFTKKKNLITGFCCEKAHRLYLSTDVHFALLRTQPENVNKYWCNHKWDTAKLCCVRRRTRTFGWSTVHNSSNLKLPSEMHIANERDRATGARDSSRTRKYLDCTFFNYKMAASLSERTKERHS